MNLPYLALAALVILSLPLTGCGEKTAEEKRQDSVLFKQKLKNLLPEERVSYVKKKAEEGDADSQNALGYLYAKGEGVPKDYANAVEWYQKAAAQGSADGQYHLGLMYRMGQGVPKDYAKAMEWCQKSAAQENVGGQNLIAVMYENGEGVPNDSEKAINWYQKAAAQGDLNAQYNLGLLYSKHKDMVQAYAWFNLAAVKGDEDTKKARDSIENFMSPAERIEGQRLASNWKMGDTTLHR